MKEQGSVSLADRVFETLEQHILSEEYAPGTLLTEVRLSETLGVSRTPIREAVRRLEQEGLLRESGKGMIVVGVTRQDLADIYEIRERIEGLCAARAARNMSDEQIDALRETMELQEFYTQKQNAAGIRNTDSLLHEMIYDHCGSNVLRDTLATLHRKLQRYRKESVTDGRRASLAAGEHRAIMEAIAARDPERAEMLMVRHIQNAKQHILDKE